MNNPDPAAPSDGGLRTAFPATLLLALAALAAVAPLATDAYLPAFGQMADDLGVSASSVQLTMTTFLVGIALGQLGIGVLSDRFGRRPLLLWGSVLALAASICSALAPSLPFLLVARFFQGLGGAAGMVLGRAVISDRSRGITAARALSVVMAIQGIAPVVAPILGGVLVELIGWRGILGVVAAFTGLLVLMVIFWVPESLPSERRHDGGLRILLDGTRELARDHVLMRLLVINALTFGLLMAYLSAAPFILRNVLGMGTVTYTAVFGLCGATVTATIAAAASMVRRFPQVRQVRVGLAAVLAVDVVFAAVARARRRRGADGAARRGHCTLPRACGLPRSVAGQRAGARPGPHWPLGRDGQCAARIPPVRRGWPGQPPGGLERGGQWCGLRRRHRGDRRDRQCVGRPRPARAVS